MEHPMLEQLLDYPVIAAAKTMEGLSRALASPSHVVFVLFGDLCNIGRITEKIRDAGKLAIVHIDLIDGLANRDISVEYLRQNTMADGIISTKAQLIHRAKELGLITVQRFFLLDSLSLENVRRHISGGSADFIELLPGVMPKIIRSCVQELGIPIIAGGLISDKDDVLSTLGAGATAVSTTKEALWFE